MGDFNKIINVWLAGYSKGQVPIEAAARIEALKDLFKAFKLADFPMEYFTNTVKAKITTYCINPNHSNKRKKKNWIQYVAKHMDIAFYSVYDGSAKMEDNDMLPEPITASDMEISNEDIKALDAQDKENQVYKPKPKEVKKVVVKEYVKSITPPPIEMEIDPEMAELMGIKLK